MELVERSYNGKNDEGVYAKMLVNSVVSTVQFPHPLPPSLRGFEKEPREEIPSSSSPSDLNLCMLLVRNMVYLFQKHRTADLGRILPLICHVKPRPYRSVEPCLHVGPDCVM